MRCRALREREVEFGCIRFAGRLTRTGTLLQAAASSVVLVVK